MNEKDTEAEGPSPTNAELYAILKNVVRAVHDQGAQRIYEQARLDALQAAVIGLATGAGIPQKVFLARLSAWREAFYQKRLDDLENENPAAAAAAYIRRGIPDLDPEILDHIRRAFEDLDLDE